MIKLYAVEWRQEHDQNPHFITYAELASSIDQVHVMEHGLHAYYGTLTTTKRTILSQHQLNINYAGIYL